MVPPSKIPAYKSVKGGFGSGGYKGTGTTNGMAHRKTLEDSAKELFQNMLDEAAAKSLGGRVRIAIVKRASSKQGAKQTLIVYDPADDTTLAKMTCYERKIIPSAYQPPTSSGSSGTLERSLIEWENFTASNVPRTVLNVGFSSKRDCKDQRGENGEGLNIAIATALRNGCGVTIFGAGYEKWRFETGKDNIIYHVRRGKTHKPFKVCIYGD